MQPKSISSRSLEDEIGKADQHIIIGGSFSFNKTLATQVDLQADFKYITRSLLHPSTYYTLIMSGNVVNTTAAVRPSDAQFMGNSPAPPTNMPKKKKLSYCVGIISVLVIIAGAAALSFGLFTETSTQTAGQSIHQLDTDTELLLGGDEKTTLHEEETALSSHLRRGTIVNNRGLDECNCELIRHRRTLLEEGLAEEEQDSIDVKGCDCSEENLEVEDVSYIVVI